LLNKIAKSIGDGFYPVSKTLHFAGFAVIQIFWPQPIEMTPFTSDHLKTTLLFNDRSVDHLADTVSVSPFSEAL
jgi:hypothetical protein